MRSLVVPALEQLGEPTNADSDLTSKLRGLLVGAAGVLGNDVGTQAGTVASGTTQRAAMRPPSTRN